MKNCSKMGFQRWWWRPVISIPTGCSDSWSSTSFQRKSLRTAWLTVKLLHCNNFLANLACFWLLLYITKTSSDSTSMSLSDDPWEVTWFPGITVFYPSRDSLSISPSLCRDGWVRTGHGKPGMLWNLRISFSRPGKSFILFLFLESHGKLKSCLVD